MMNAMIDAVMLCAVDVVFSIFKSFMEFFGVPKVVKSVPHFSGLVVHLYHRPHLRRVFNRRGHHVIQRPYKPAYSPCAPLTKLYLLLKHGKNSHYNFGQRPKPHALARRIE